MPDVEEIDRKKIIEALDNPISLEEIKKNPEKKVICLCADYEGPHSLQGGKNIILDCAECSKPIISRKEGGEIGKRDGWRFVCQSCLLKNKEFSAGAKLQSFDDEDTRELRNKLRSCIETSDGRKDDEISKIAEELTGLFLKKTPPSEVIRILSELHPGKSLVIREVISIMASLDATDPTKDADKLKAYIEKRKAAGTSDPQVRVFLECDPWEGSPIDKGDCIDVCSMCERAVVVSQAGARHSHSKGHTVVCSPCAEKTRAQSEKDGTNSLRLGNLEPGLVDSVLSDIKNGGKSIDMATDCARTFHDGVLAGQGRDCIQDILFARYPDYKIPISTALAELYSGKADDQIREAHRTPGIHPCCRRVQR